MSRFVVGYLMLAVFSAFLYTTVEGSVINPAPVSIQEAGYQLIGGKPDTRCKPTGFKCSASSECCSKRCLSYSAKCVM